MNKQMTIVGLAGSLASVSRSLAAINIALEGAAAVGANTRVFDIRTLNLPFYTPGSDDIPAAVHEFCEAVYQADGLIWSSPLYHGTISGAFKNALDWLQLLSNRTPPYLTEKPVGLISTAGGTQGLQAVNTMEFVVRALRGYTVPLVMPIPQAWKVFDEDGLSNDPGIENQLRALGREVTHAAQHFATPVTAEEVAASSGQSDAAGQSHRKPSS
ncbi:MAG: NAD(P)H-dependent oxidoreductase [Chloroflexota bacterium]|nr:NAD(P)H-dependent oxidoreductase [Chloroflexota bacterium]